MHDILPVMRHSIPGVSNFEIRHLEHLLQHACVLPAVNQIEVHPRYQQVRILSFTPVHRSEHIPAMSSDSIGGCCLKHVYGFHCCTVSGSHLTVLAMFCSRCRQCSVPIPRIYECKMEQGDARC